MASVVKAAALSIVFFVDLGLRAADVLFVHRFPAIHDQLAYQKSSNFSCRVIQARCSDPFKWGSRADKQERGMSSRRGRSVRQDLGRIAGFMVPYAVELWRLTRKRRMRVRICGEGNVGSEIQVVRL